MSPAALGPKPQSRRPHSLPLQQGGSKASSLAACQLRRRAFQSSRHSLHGQHRPDTGLSHVEKPEHSGRAVFEPSPAARDSASSWAQQSFLHNHHFWDSSLKLDRYRAEPHFEPMRQALQLHFGGQYMNGKRFRTALGRTRTFGSTLLITFATQQAWCTLPLHTIMHPSGWTPNVACRSLEHERGPPPCAAAEPTTPHKELVQTRLNQILLTGSMSEDDEPRDPLEEMPVENNQAVASFGRAVYEVSSRQADI